MNNDVSSNFTYKERENYNNFFLLKLRYSLILILALFTFLSFQSEVNAALTDAATDWSNFTFFPVREPVSGEPLSDYEGGAADPTKGQASPGGNGAFASDCNAGGNAGTSGCSEALCVPNLMTGDRGCGGATSFFWACYDGGDGSTGSARTNDVFAFRLRIDGSPIQANDADLLTNGKYNILLDLDGDGFKEFWILVDGNADNMLVLHEDGAPGTQAADEVADLVDTFSACSDEATITCQSGGMDTSHTRTSQLAGTIGAGSDTEWYIDIQVPASSLCAVGVTCDSATQLADCDSNLGLFATTSDSNTDPLQKDLIAQCPDTNNSGGTDPGDECTFSQSTPITLSYFSSSVGASGAVLNWSTATEVGNAGFNIYATTAQGLVQINDSIIPSKVIDSMSPVDYSFAANASLSSPRIQVHL